MSIISPKKLKQKYLGLPVQIKASAWFFICSILQKGISTITTPIFTRILSSAEYGMFNVFSSWSGMIGTIVILCLPWGIYEQGYIKLDTVREKEKYTSALMGVMTTLCMLWWVIYIPLRDSINRQLALSSFQVGCMFAMFWTTSLFSFWSIKQRISYKYRSLVVITLVSSFFKPLLGIILVMDSEDKVTARIMGLAVVEILCFSWIFISQLKRDRSFFDKKVWSYAFKFNIPLVPHYLSQTILSGADRIMIEKFDGADKTGIYSLAYSISVLMTIANNSLLNTLSPWVMKRIKNNNISDIPKKIYPAIIFVAVINIILMLLAPEIVKVFAPEEYYDAIYVITPVTMSVPFMFLYGLFAIFEMYYEKTKMISVATFISAGFNIVLNYIFINKYGYLAAGYTTLVCYIIYALFHYVSMEKACKENFDGYGVFNPKVIGTISVTSLLLGVLIGYSYSHSAIRLAIIIVVAILGLIYYKKIIEYIKNILN